MVAAAALVAGGVVIVRTRRRATAHRQLLMRRLDLALDAGGMGTWVWDRASGRLVWDGRIAELYGTAPASVDGWMQLVHPEDRPAVDDAVRRSLEEGSRFHVDHRRLLADDAVRWLELRGEPILDDDGELLGTAGVVVDVTEEREAAAELAASRAAMERLLDLAPAFTVEERVEDVPVRICDVAMTLFGCDASGIWAFEHGDLRSLASLPVGIGGATGPRLTLPELPLLRQRLGGRAPAFVVAGQVGSEAIDELLRAGGLRCGYVVPLGGDREQGLFLTMWWRQLQARPTLAEQAVVRRFGDQVALALEQARSRAALEEVQALGEALQRGLLPSPSLRDGRVRVTERYRPTEDRILLGGDFYDVADLPDGSIGFVVGDVTGHGPGPAAVGTALRAAWRALALTMPGPANWLDGLSAALASYEAGTEVLATACTGRIAPDGSSVVLAGAGHPAPMVVQGGEVRQVELPPATPLGVEPPGTTVTTVEVALLPRWRLLLYTDGVIDVRAGRRTSDRVGEEGLRAWLEAHDPTGADPDELLDDLVGHLERLQHAPLADDLALVLLDGVIRPATGTRRASRPEPSARRR